MECRRSRPPPAEPYLEAVGVVRWWVGVRWLELHAVEAVCGVQPQQAAPGRPYQQRQYRVLGWTAF